MLFCSSKVRQGVYDGSSSLTDSVIMTFPSIISSAVSASHSRTAVGAAARGGGDCKGNGEVNSASRCDDSSLTGRDGRDGPTTIPGDPGNVLVNRRGSQTRRLAHSPTDVHPSNCGFGVGIALLFSRKNAITSGPQRVVGVSQDSRQTPKCLIDECQW